MESRITENGINYVLVGYYYIPEIEIKEESRLIGKCGMLRKQYLKEHKSGRFSVLVIKGELDQMEWVRRVNDIKNRAEKIALSELVYA